LAEQQSALRVNAVIERLAKAEGADSVPPQSVKPAPISLSAERTVESPDPVRARSDSTALAALDRKTGVDLQELSDAVQSVMGGFTPFQISSMGDEEFAAGSERILAAL